jgi:hypothetical protein
LRCVRLARLRSLLVPAPCKKLIVADLAQIEPLCRGIDTVEVPIAKEIHAYDPTGVPFDPNMHQAMSEQETTAHPPGSVMAAWTPTWTLHGRLLRAAMVVVAKAPPAEIGASARLNTTA